MRRRAHHRVRAILTALAALSVTATAGHAQITVATRDSQLLESPFADALGVTVGKLKPVGPGVFVDDMVHGAGAEATRGLVARVRVEVWLPDATRVLGGTCQSLQFQIGRGTVVSGVDIGIRGMRVGGTRLLVIGAERAYGARGVPGDVPQWATLVARVQLLDVSEGNFPNPNDCLRA